MKLELNEILITDLTKNNYTNFKSFQDIFNCFERQNNLFKSLEKDLTIKPFYQILFTFGFLLFLSLSFSFFSILIKSSIAYFFHKFMKSANLEFSFSGFIYSSLSFTSSKNKILNHKFKTYQEEKKIFLIDFFSIPINKTIILDFLHNFYKENEHRLSSDIYSEIDSIKSFIEKENYELAFDKILAFKKRIEYIKSFN